MKGLSFEGKTTLLSLACFHAFTSTERGLFFFTFIHSVKLKLVALYCIKAANAALIFCKYEQFPEELKISLTEGKPLQQYEDSE